jgi:hypothetical protein
MAVSDRANTTIAAKIEAAFEEEIARSLAFPDEVWAAHFTKRAADYRRNLPTIEKVIAAFVEVLGWHRAPPLRNLAEVLDIGRLAETVVYFRAIRQITFYSPHAIQQMRGAIRDLSLTLPDILAKTEREAADVDINLDRPIDLLRTLIAAIAPFEKIARSRIDRRSFIPHAAIRNIAAKVRIVLARQGLSVNFTHEDTDATKITRLLLNLCKIYAEDGAIVEAVRGRAGKIIRSRQPT